MNTSNIADQIPDPKSHDLTAANMSPLLEKRLEDGEAASNLARDRFRLTNDEVRQKMMHEQTEFNPILKLKQIVFWAAIAYVSVLALSLLTYIWWGDERKHDWHVLVVLVSGAYLSIFGVFALLIKGLFSKQAKQTVGQGNEPEASNLLKDLLSLLYNKNG